MPRSFFVPLVMNRRAKAKSTKMFGFFYWADPTVKTHESCETLLVVARQESQPWFA